jgi:hypothetical protein
MPVDKANAELIADVGAEEFARWRHAPAGRLFFAFLNDQLANWREAASDMVLVGAFDVHAATPGRNPHYVGGQMRAYDDLLRLALSDIQTFYREATGGEAGSEVGRTEAP